MLTLVNKRCQLSSPTPVLARGAAELAEHPPALHRRQPRPVPAQDRAHPVGEEEEAALCGQLAKALGAAKGDKAMEASILEGEWRLVYGLAESIMSRTLVQAEAEELLAAETEKAALKVANRKGETRW